MTKAEREERARLLREHLRQQGRAEFYEANPDPMKPPVHKESTT